VEGASYLAADLGVPCFDTSHIVSFVLGTCVLVLLGMGLPAFICLNTKKLLVEKAKFGFLFGKSFYFK
jgi:hypothetical protein